MKLGDLAECEHNYQFWGIILAESTDQYEIYWMDGDRSWISKRAVKKNKKYLTILNNGLCYKHLQLEE